MAPRATITDVAKHAGVSKVTVSYVLNGRGKAQRISPQTQQRVLRSAAELGYTPSAIARSLMTGPLDTLAVVFQHAAYFADRSDFTMELMHGVTEGALAAGYNLMLHTKPLHDVQAEIAELMNGSVSGVLVLRNEDDEVVEALIKREFPLVLFFTRVEREGVAYVDADNGIGAELATEHLVQLGHRRLGMISGDPHSRAAQDRIAGFRRVLTAHNISLDPSDLLFVESGQESHKIKEYAQRRDLPSAVFCFSDLYAFHLMNAAQEAGLAVPEDLSVVGFDSVNACERSSPTLTSVRQPVREIAEKAVTLLVHILNKNHQESRQVIFPTSLDIRRSTAPPRPSSTF